MLIGERFVFLHVPKAAGKSLTRYMIEAWPGPIDGWVSKGQMAELRTVARQDVCLEVSSGHEGMRRAQIVLNERGKRVQDMSAVFVCVRNPYDMVVSTYFFMRRTFEHNRDRRNFQLANALEFEEFCEQYEPRAMEAWLTLNGRALDNLRVLRFESLAQDVAAAAAKYGFNPATLAHLNRTAHGHYASYVRSAACERTIYEKYRYFFDSDLYERYDVR